MDSSTYTSIFSTVFEGSEVGVDTALDYFIENYEAIIEKYSKVYNSYLNNPLLCNNCRFTESGLDIAEIFSSVASYITQTEQITKVSVLIYKFSLC